MEKGMGMRENMRWDDKGAQRDGKDEE